MADDSTKPVSRMIVPMSFGSIIVSTWADGHKAVQLQIDEYLRAANPPEGASDATNKKYKAFHEFGQLPLYESDGVNLMDVAMTLRPDVVLSRRT